MHGVAARLPRACRASLRHRQRVGRRATALCALRIAYAGRKGSNGCLALNGAAARLGTTEPLLNPFVTSPPRRASQRATVDGSATIRKSPASKARNSLLPLRARWPCSDCGARGSVAPSQDCAVLRHLSARRLAYDPANTRCQRQQDTERRIGIRVQRTVGHHRVDVEPVQRRPTIDRPQRDSPPRGALVVAEALSGRVRAMRGRPARAARRWRTRCAAVQGRLGGRHARVGRAGDFGD